MKEIIINYNNQKKDILVLENGIIVEQYQEYDDMKTLEGNIYVGRVIDVLPGMQAAFIDIGEEKNAFLHIKDVLPKASNVTGNKNKKLSASDISDYIKVGDSIIVQIKKDKNESKGARVSTDINIAGRYAALIPNSNFVTVSSKIESREEVDRLKLIAQKSIKESMGIIFRTASEGVDEKKLLKDISDLQKLNEKINNSVKQCISSNEIPRKVYDAGGIVNKVLLGLIEKCNRVVINKREIYDWVIEDYKEYSKIVEHKENQSLVDDSMQAQLEKFKNRKIWLNCGGFITIDKTEALTAIDVNTGKYTGKHSLEETVLKVNEEATVEIAKQIRARDIGGIIIVDYIDMEEKDSENKIIELMNKQLKNDRAKTQVIGFTPLHLLEMTRKHLCSN